MHLLPILASLLLTACATQENYAAAVNSWQGADQEAVYRVWGYPNKIDTLPNGNKLLVYRDVDKGQNPVYTTPGSTSVVTNPNGTSQVNVVSATVSGGNTYYYECNTWFELSSKGKVLNTSFRGNNCIADKNFLNTHLNQGN